MQETRSFHESSERDQDRRLIQLDYVQSQEGIAAALRRAFASASEPSVRDEFDELLAQIH